MKVLFRRELAAAEDPEAKMKQLVEEFKRATGDVYTTAERLICNDIIAPHETRKRIIQKLDILRTKNQDMCFLCKQRRPHGFGKRRERERSKMGWNGLWSGFGSWT